MTITRLGDVDEGAERPLPAGVTRLGDVEPPPTGEVVRGIPERAGLQLIGTAGGAMRALGDLLDFESLAGFGGEMARTAEGAQQESMPAGPSTMQQAMSGGLESALMMGPAMATKAVAVGLPLAVGTTVAPRYSELRDKEFSGGQAAFVSAIDGIMEAVGERSGLKVLDDAARPFLNKATHFLLRDMVGEQVTTIGQQLNALLADRPDMTLGEFLEGMKMTALATPFAAGGQIAMRAGAQGAQSLLAPPVPPEAVDPAQQPAPEPVVQAPPPEPPAPVAPEPQPQEPPQEPPAPTGETPPVDYGNWKADHGDSYWHPVTGVRIIQKDGGGWELFHTTTGDTIWTARTQQEAFDFAKRYEWDSDPVGSSANRADGMQWAWADDYRGLKHSNLPGYKIERNGPHGWALMDSGSLVKQYPKGKKLVDLLNEATFDVFQHEEVKHRQQTAPEPAPKRPPSLLELTWEQMHASGQYDPRVYNGAAGQDGYVEVDSRGPGESYRIFYNKLLAHDDLSREEALAKLRISTGLDHTDPQQLKTMYDAAALQAMIDTGKVGSVAVQQYFGDNTHLLASYGAQRQNAKGGVPTKVDVTPVWAQQLHNRGIANRPVHLKAVGSSTLHDLSQPLQNTTYVEHWSDGHASPAITRVAGFLEQLRKIYMPDAKLFIRETDPIEKALRGVQGSMTARLPGEYHIYVPGDAASPKELARLLRTAAHEFGHAIIAHHFMKASGAVKAELTVSWLRYTKDLQQDSSLGQYFTQHHAWDRSPDAQARVRDGVNADYFLSQYEYFADQAAYYFMNHSPAAQSMSGHVRQWFEELVRLLKGMFDRYKVSGVIEDKTFYEWLDSLADHNNKAGPRRPNNPTPDPPKPIGKGPQGRPLPLDPERIAAMQKQMLKIWNLLYEAGATREEMEALFVGSTVHNFRIDDAIKLMDKYGVPRREWLGTYDVGSVDEMTSFREQLFTLRNSPLIVEDREVHAALAGASSAVKSFNAVLRKTITAVQLRKRFGAQVPGVKNFVDTLEKMFAYRSKWKERADDRLKEVQQVSQKERAEVFKILLEEDRTGEYASTITMQGTPGQRVFTLREDVAKKHGLTEKGIRLYAGLRSDFDSALAEIENEAVGELYRLYGQGTPALQKAESDLRHAFSEMKAKPYVPHTRFGEHTVTVRDEKGRVVEFYQFESERDAKTQEAKSRAAAEKGYAVSRGKMEERFRVMMGLPPQLINAMKGQLKLTAEQISEFEDILKEMSHGASFVRRFKRRKNVEGWEDDAEQFPRAYADYMSRFANHVSRLRYNHVLTAATTEVGVQTAAASRMGQNTVELNELRNWLSQLHEYVNEPGVEYANARAVATLWYLGLNVKSALVNATSVPFVTLPYLSQRFGEARALGAVTQAYRDLANMYFRKKSLSDDERKFLEYMRETGKTDQSFATELAGIREGGRLSDQMALSKPKASFYGVKYWGMLAFQKMEVINRMTTGLAAYRLQRTGKAFSEEDPYGFDRAAAEFAGHAIQDTQNENAQWNRPEFMRGRKSVLTLFMSYQQNLLYQMMGGDDSWMRLLAVQLMVAGLMGLPFADDADELIKWVSRKAFGKDFSPERAVRQYLVDVTGPGADWLMKGVSHNLAGVNLQGSLSQGRVIPGVDALAMEGRFADRILNAAGDVGGAGISIILNVMKAIASDDPQLTKRAMQAMPEFIRSLNEGGKMFTEGHATDAAGRKLTDVSELHSVARMVGFQVSDVAKERAKRQAQKDVAQYWLARRANVMALYEIAADSRDDEWRDKALTALREFNDEAPDHGLRITSKQLQQSLRSRQRADSRIEQGRGPSRTVEQTYQRIGELYQ